MNPAISKLAKATNWKDLGNSPAPEIENDFLEELKEHRVKQWGSFFSKVS